MDFFTVFNNFFKFHPVDIIFNIHQIAMNFIFGSDYFVTSITKITFLSPVYPVKQQLFYEAKETMR